MKLEEAIQSTKQMAPRHRALLNILYTASWLDCEFQRQLRPFGLTGPQYNILRILNGSAPLGLSVLDIKARMLDRNSNVSRLVEKLKQSGYVERCPNSDDRRMVIVSISEKGKELLHLMDGAAFIKADTMPGQALSEEEAAFLGELLDRFRE